MNLHSQTQPPTPPSLRWQWAGFVLLCVSTLGAGYLVLRLWWPPASIVPWLLAAALAFGYQAVTLWRGLPLNRYEGEPDLLPRLERSAMLTLARGVLLGVMAGFTVLRCPTECCPTTRQSCHYALVRWGPAVLYTAATLSDVLGMYLARRSARKVTLLSERLDRDFEALGILVASIAGVTRDRLPGLYLLAPLAHYLFVAGTWLRKRQGSPVHKLPFGLSRRVMTWVQKGFLCIALWPFFSYWDIETVAMFLMLPFVIGFVKDWLIVSGVLEPASPRYQQAAHAAGQVAAWAPLGLRLIIVAILAASAVEGVFSGLISATSYYPERGHIIVLLSLVLALVELLSLALFAVGLAGRIAAAALLLLVFLGFIPGRIGLLVCAVALLHLGTGRLSLWTEDRLLARYIGRGPKERHFDSYPQDGDSRDALSRKERFLQILRSEHLSYLTKKWRTPVKLSKPVKILVALGTAWIILYRFLFFAVWLSSFASLIAAGNRGGFPFFTTPFFAMASLQLPTRLLQFALVTFYLVHVIKNTTALEIARIILSVGIFYLPSVAMPIYYYLYIWHDQPPAWALTQEAESGGPMNEFTG